MNFIECSDHMKDQWSKPKSKPRFKHIENKTEILEFELIIYKANLVIRSIVSLQIYYNYE